MEWAVISAGYRGECAVSACGGWAPTAGKARAPVNPRNTRDRGSSGAPKSGEIGWTTTPALPSGGPDSTEPGVCAIGAEDVHIHGYRSAGPTHGMGPRTWEITWGRPTRRVEIRH